MDQFYKITVAPLEPHELKKLKKGIFIMPIVTIFIIGFFSMVLTQFDLEGTFLKIFGGFAILFMTVLIFIVRGYVLDLRDQTKEILQGVITRKVKRRQKKKKGSSTSYYFYFGDKSILVPLHIWGQFEEADMIEVHRSKRISNLIYKTELMKRGVLVEQVQEIKEAHEAKEQKMTMIALIIFVVIVGVVILLANIGILG
ncbi:MAG: hypothetical protein R8G66_00100 [Cytophagales bacterium]|nr:hypothetical protein [Cytophagales bacterium]